ncbi:hypothetical protein [Chryseobacterium sediminis]|uniref:Uncharacterized protein n=1 Tax=Chryseobacterium sediminis TaxID=1679494 RepID=A0A5B2U8T8_9FLAO|nr:hypothetical protein [Chryseobacterium sediminis]KAA2223051.1 hypothetical protein FW780_02265 [Chryseobacterium sediminis]
MYGLCGQLCHHFGWTLDYLLEEVDYAFLQRMLIDAPSYDYDKDEDVKKDTKKGKSFDYSELSQESFLSQLEQYK